MCLRVETKIQEVLSKMNDLEIIRFYKNLLNKGVIKWKSAGHDRLQQLIQRRWKSDKRT